MYRVELYAQVRRSVIVEGLSEREAVKRFGLARETVRKMLRYRIPPGYRRNKPVRRPKLEAFTGIINQNLLCFQKCFFKPRRVKVFRIGRCSSSLKYHLKQRLVLRAARGYPNIMSRPELLLDFLTFTIFRLVRRLRHGTHTCIR